MRHGDTVRRDAGSSNKTELPYTLLKTETGGLKVMNEPVNHNEPVY